jgi:divalent metal cation (Fe/Co/Zn/Cd) transporter
VGALIGLVFALAGVGLAIATAEPRFDALGSIAIGVLLAGIAVVLAKEMKSLLIGESAAPEVTAAIRAALEATSQVRRVIHLRTLHLGPEDLLVAAKIELDASLCFADVARAIDAAEARVRDQVPSARMIFLEPDVMRAAQGPDGS